MSKLDELDKEFDEKFAIVGDYSRSCDLCGHDHTHLGFKTIEKWRDDYGKDSKAFARKYYEAGRMDAAREIGLIASSAGLAPKDLAKEEDWKEAVEKIKNSEREALKKLIRKIGEESEWPITDLLNEL